METIFNFIIEYLEPFRGVVLHMQLLLVFIIIVACFQVYKVYQEKAFQLIYLAWCFNLLYIIAQTLEYSRFVDKIGISENGYDFIALLLDGLFGFILIYSIRNEFKEKWVRVYYQLATLVFIIYLILYLFDSRELSNLLYWSFIFSALFVFSIYIHRNVLFNNGLKRGFKAYALLQLLGFIMMFCKYSWEGNWAEVSLKGLGTLGFSFGFLIKLYIAYGFFKLFQVTVNKKIVSEEVYKANKKTLAVTIHEALTPTLAMGQIIEDLLTNPNEKDLDPKYKFNRKVRDKLEELDYSSTLILAVMDAFTKEVNIDDIIKIDSKKIELFNDKELVITSLNTLSFIAIMAVKRSRNTLTNIEQINFVQEYSRNCNIYCYKNEIIQVIINLVRNAGDAIKDSNNKSIKIRTFKDKIPIDGKKKTVSLAIEDFGKGINETLKGKIFEFGVTSQTGKMRGVGLHVVQKNIKNNFGHIMVESPIKFDHISEDKNGARFTITFPRV